MKNNVSYHMLVIILSILVYHVSFNARLVNSEEVLECLSPLGSEIKYNK